MSHVTKVCFIQLLHQVKYAEFEGACMGTMLWLYTVSHWCKKYRNRPRKARVIIKNKVARFLWLTVYNHNMVPMHAPEIHSRSVVIMALQSLPKLQPIMQRQLSQPNMPIFRLLTFLYRYRLSLKLRVRGMLRPLS